MKTDIGSGFLMLLAVLLVLSGCPNPSGVETDPSGPSGSVDTSFGTDGMSATDFSSCGFNRAGAFAIHSDGDILVAGSCYEGSTAIAVARYYSNGTLNSGFDEDGVKTLDFGSAYAAAKAIAVQSDGKIIVAGECGDWPYDYCIARMHPDGSFDTSFGTDGMVTTDLNSGADFCNGAALQSDGKLIAAGRSFTGSSYDFSLARYNSDGSLDTAFDSDGMVTTDFESSDDKAYGIALQSDGKILVTGYSSVNGTNDFALVRYNPDGSLDAAFGTDGMVVTDFTGKGDEARCVVIQPDGRIILAGMRYQDLDSAFGLVRYWP